MRPEWDELERRNRRAQERPQRIFALAVVVSLALLGWRHFFREDEMPTPVGPTIAARVTETPAVLASPPPPVVRSTSVPPRANLDSAVGVYECMVSGQRVVSDRPCGPGATPRVLVL